MSEQTFYPGQPAADFIARLNLLALAMAATSSPVFAGMTLESNGGTTETLRSAGANSQLKLQRANGTLAAKTIVANGNALAALNFEGWDGAGFVAGASIRAEVDGTPGAGDMPGRLVFSVTPDGSATPVEAMRIGNDRTVYLGAAPGAESLRVSPVAGAVNQLRAFGNVSSVAPTFTANGADSAVNMQFDTKGGGVHAFATAGAQQFRVAHSAGSVNLVQVSGSASGLFPSISTSGTDASPGLVHSTKGVGEHQFYTGNSLQLKVTNTNSAANWFNMTGSVTGNTTYCSNAGSDTNIGMSFEAKGAGTINLQGAGSNQFRITPVASAVNFAQVAGAITGGGVAFSGQGSDANVSLGFVSKGTFAHVFYTAGGAQLEVGHTASAVNWLRVQGAATGNPVIISAQGSDAAIDLWLNPKATGHVRFGTWTSNADSAINGYITIKDAAGNVRKLATIA